jgi:hypothetical protein
LEKQCLASSASTARVSFVLAIVPPSALLMPGCSCLLEIVYRILRWKVNTALGENYIIVAFDVLLLSDGGSAGKQFSAATAAFSTSSTNARSAVIDGGMEEVGA